LFGANLAAEFEQPTTSTLPAKLAGTAVTIDGSSAPILFASPTQVNIQIPFQIAGQAELRLNNGNGEVSVSLPVLDAAPGILALAHPDGRVVSASAPVSGGQMIIVYAAGLGALQLPVRAGDPGPSNPLAACSHPVEALVGSQSLVPDYAGLAPGLPATYQVNVKLPPSIRAGDSIALIAGGQESNRLPLPVSSEPLASV
jgi:uncharacterized protein (TIGR03437 family)